jgi:hypothetical protein
MWDTKAQRQPGFLTNLRCDAHHNPLELVRHKIQEMFLNQLRPNGVKHLPPNEAAWQEILASFEEVRKCSVTGEPHRWTRADFYDDPATSSDHPHTD